MPFCPLSFNFFLKIKLNFRWNFYLLKIILWFPWQTWSSVKDCRRAEVWVCWMLWRHGDGARPTVQHHPPPRTQTITQCTVLSTYSEHCTLWTLHSNTQNTVHSVLYSVHTQNTIHCGHYTVHTQNTVYCGHYIVHTQNIYTLWTLHSTYTKHCVLWTLHSTYSEHLHTVDITQ